jgi:chemotaxis family two-component system response regulator Rcp1
MATETVVKQILLIEDNPADSRLFQEALKATDSPHKMWVARDGNEGLQMLHQSGSPAMPRPDLILLDLNLPGMSGWEVLGEIKHDNNLRHIPVIILTSSRSPEDVTHAYRLHANSYLCKPVRLAEVFELVSEIERYWFKVASIPSRMAGA